MMILFSMPGIADLFFLLILMIPAAIWIYALVDCLKGEFSGNDKAVWVLVIGFFNIIGAIIYLLVGRIQKISRY